MLVQLEIENIAIIKKSCVTFSTGLTVFTGQTGAGKSILLDALSLCLGARAEQHLIRHGQESATVNAVFDIRHLPSIMELLKEQAIPVDSNLLFIRRILFKNGNNRCFLNDYSVSLHLIKRVAKELIEMHQQFDPMLESSFQRVALDNYASLSELCTDTKTAFDAWKQAEQAYDDYRHQLLTWDREKDFLQSSVQELSKFNPTPNEEAYLSEQRQFIKQKKSILDTYNLVANKLDQEIKPILFQLEKSLSKLDDSTSISLQTSIDKILSEVTEMYAKSKEHLLTFDAGLSLEDIEQRLFELRHLARKYNCLSDELSNILHESKLRLAKLDSLNLDIKNLETAVTDAKNHFFTTSKELSQRRHSAALELSNLIMNELPPLKLSNANFKISVSQLTEHEWSSYGIDHIEFLVDMNQQGIFVPLNKIASGGEMARLMLALKVCLAHSNATPVLVFDEIDSGISGDVANAVGQRLKKLATHLQVLVITHSPQVASAGDNHWVIEKTLHSDHVETKPILLTFDQRIDEIARMMAGDFITEESKAAALVLLKQSF